MIKKRIELLMEEETLIKLGFTPIQQKEDEVKYMLYDKDPPVEIIYRWDDHYNMYRFEAQVREHYGKPRD